MIRSGWENGSRRPETGMGLVRLPEIDSAFEIEASSLKNEDPATESKAEFEKQSGANVMIFFIKKSGAGAQHEFSVYFSLFQKWYIRAISILKFLQDERMERLSGGQ